ncbi:MAG TPA: acetate/propionate family kinase [Candidatus Limnocylindria bacterium]|nr:acetate/propionate family kinase [Candidatus Limnocylindria bacterium]
MTPARVLVLNPGSSSLKASVVVEPGDRTDASRDIDWGISDAGAGARLAALERLVSELRHGRRIDAVGYRVVHGGELFRDPVLVDDGTVEAIEALDELAPLHNRVAVETIRAGRRLLPDLPHVACFDTSFHATLPVDAYRYPLPGKWVERFGIRRFGFHGLSVAWSVERAAAELGRPAGELRLVVAHLGSGCSVTAVDRGRSAATSMGFTPLEGLMMGTRSGSIDPGIVLHLARHAVEVERIADGLEHQSGLLGASGTTASARGLEQAAASGDERARVAIAMFCRSAAAGIAAAATALDGCEGIVFTAGIGEHSQSIREDVCRRLSVLGVGQPGGPAVLVVEAREDLVIARRAASVIGFGQ